MNRDFALSQASEAVRSIVESLDEDKASRLSPEEERGHTAVLLEEFKVQLTMTYFIYLIMYFLFRLMLIGF